MTIRNFLCCVLSLTLVPSVFADSKVKMKTTMQGAQNNNNNQPGGMGFETTSYIKGQRFRNENSFAIMGASLATIRQCDLKRTIQVNDKNKTYMIVPDREPGAATASTPSPKPSPSAEPEPTEPTRHGGTVTITANVKDTGERKEMFGHTARHVIATMTTEASANACHPGKSEFQIDGWYIDFNPGQQSCVKPEQQVLDVLKPDFPTAAPTRGRTSGGCEDDYKFQGSGLSSFQKLGFAVQTTMTMTDSEGKKATFVREAEDVSSATLDPALFDVPAGYKEVNSMTALMGITARGVLGAMVRGGARNEQQSAMGTTNPSTAPGDSGPKTGRLCVAPIQDSSGRWTANSSLQQRASNDMQSGGVTAIAATEGCPYILNISITDAKDASAAKKIGGLLGRGLPGRGSESSGSEAKVSYQITRASDHSTVTSGTADAKGSNADEAVAAAINKAAQQAAGKVPPQ